MPTWETILIAVFAVLAVALLIGAVGYAMNRRRTQRLRQHYGSEYERLVSQTGGQKEAEKELIARERQREKLDIVPLAPAARSDFTTRWNQVQTAFVDNPTTAVGVADRLVTDVMRERGYPVDNFDQRAADISVDHPQIVDNYRAAHAVHLSQQHGEVSTEQQREAFVHYRALFEKLLETTPQEAKK
ncbi:MULTISPECIES: hypothetical protein [unclassified Mycobacterium]|uniref:hypothetical protein n=1 Tax=unclassified Mycobacterium TaxID=2642494 RepID=UPI000F9BE3DF|nr:MULTISPECIES: hypothetical protein [unclassified Mycobacterium]MDP7706377.1 hypothetical protein [Mycobacterium sp. TY815]MDP7725848.1 hypothetical protein [Mycobacterium sp. TY814]RUP03095.1 MAG: hypothetical protein EKK34_20590 [Mycobacterium sp.]